MDLVFLLVVGIIAVALIAKFVTKEAKEGKCKLLPGGTRQTSAAGNNSLSTDKGLSGDSPLSIYLQELKRKYIFWIQI